MRKFFVLAFALVLVLSYASAETLCSYKGPDVSADLMRLTDFSVTGNASLKVGDTITVKFTLQNFGQSDITLGSKGIFTAATNPLKEDASFGFSFANISLKVGEVKTIEVSRVLDKAGAWKIWPSYHISLPKSEKFGPNEWHVCTLSVSAPPTDSDNDGFPDAQDNCPNVSNQDQLDSDQDGKGNVCDNCPQNANPQQEDIDADGAGDACDNCDDRDSDSDGIKNCTDQCPNEAETVNNYQDSDGCADSLPQTNVELKITPEKPKKGEEFEVIATAAGSVKKLVILVNGSKVKECDSSPCIFDGVAAADDPAIGATMFDSFGSVATGGRIPWDESPDACLDTDHGINIWAPGYATNETTRIEGDTIYLPTLHYDTCTDDDHILEYYCDGNEVKSIASTCDCMRAPRMVLPDGNSIPIEGDKCACVDSDGGRDYFTRGSAIDKTDECLSIGTLKEYFCDMGSVSSETVRCACEEGACRCVDSDGGRKHYTWGSFAFDPLDREDTCRDSRNLTEYYCDSAGKPAHEDVTCFDCARGRCLCEDSDGGVNYFVRGRTSFGNEDYCVNTGTLAEYSVRKVGDDCEQDYQEVACGAGCENGACKETCDDGIQNHGEAGIDCGGPCPARCTACVSSAIVAGTGREAGQFSINDPDVYAAAVQAVMEYTDCLRDDGCRSTLPTVTYLSDYSTVDVSTIICADCTFSPKANKTQDMIMEAVAYYVNNHMRYMYDSDDGPVQSARNTILNSHSRSGTVCLEDYSNFPEGTAFFSETCESATHVDVCPNDYCGDCEDFCHLRGGLMRNLGIKSYCMYCADHYNGYWGGGHTFNMVIYQGKWRIMDYGALGSGFYTDWSQHQSQNIYNDERGRYWCADWQDALGDGTWSGGIEGCDKLSPSSRTWNYEGGDHCPDSYSGYWTYRKDTCP